MTILYSFEENKLEYKDKDAVEIKMMGTGMDTESLEHNLYENDITSIICHNFHQLQIHPSNRRIRVFSTWMAFGGNTRDLAHLENKRTRLRLYTKSLKKLCIQSVETASRVSSDNVRTFEVTASKHGRPKETLKDFVLRD
ncbi:hypothetical protein Tco_1220082 [Tanacetum coccineum]